MKLNLSLKLKFNINWFFKLVYPLLILIIGIGFAFTGMFLYNDFYQTITHSEHVIILRAEVAPALVDIKLFDEVMQNLDNKIAKPEVDTTNIYNAFVPTSALNPTTPIIE